MERLALLDRLRQAPIARHLPLAQLDRLAGRSRLRRLAKGDLLLCEGEAGSEVHLVLTGRVAVLKRGAGGESKTLAERLANAWVGEMALIDDGGRSASVMCEEPVEVLSVPFDAFLEMLGGSPQGALDLARVVTDRLRESDAKLIEALQQQNQRLNATNRRLRREHHRLRGELDRRHGFETFVGTSPAAKAVREAAQRAAESDVPVLLLGETGTGKEIVARAIHAASARGDARPDPVTLNCALFSEGLLESELFGHVRGAFTGAARDKPGLVEEAHRGTLLLDEVADIPPPLQGALLRFLELGEFRRLGETASSHADVRVIAATHRDLDRAVSEGRFRRDLLFRLDVLRIPLPPLRERREDIPVLAAHIVETVARRLGASPLRLAGAALDVLCDYAFPGNVRELENEIERLYAVLGAGAEVQSLDLSPRILGSDPVACEGYTDAVRAFKSRLLVNAVKAAEGNRTRAAESLGLHRSNLSRMLRDLGLESV